MPQIMDTCGMVRAAIGPTQLPPQLTEDAMHLAVTQWQAMQSPPTADEERGVVVVGLARQVAPLAIPPQGVERGGMHRHLA